METEINEGSIMNYSGTISTFVLESGKVIVQKITRPLFLHPQPQALSMDSHTLPLSK